MDKENENIDDKLSEQEQIDIINDFSSKLINSQQDLDPEFLNIVSDNFYELL